MKKTYKIEDAAKVKTEMIREYLQYIKERGKYTVVGKEHSRSHNFPELQQFYVQQIIVLKLLNMHICWYHFVLKN